MAAVRYDMLVKKIEEAKAAYELRIKQLLQDAAAADREDGEALLASLPGKKKKPGATGRKYNGTHWTQRPENRARMLAMLRRRKQRRA